MDFLPWDGKQRKEEKKKERGLVSQTVKKRLTPRIKWYRNETIVEQMPGHKTTTSFFPSPYRVLPPKSKPTSVSPNGSRQTAVCCLVLSEVHELTVVL